jgi:A/G-specific adenine glycosylase
MGKFLKMKYNDFMNIFPLEQAHALAAWYDHHKRALPWRDTGDPYAVWISEIMLQQTRIEAVKPKYTAFMKALPDINSLAEVEEDDLMKLWEGLGYYSRARNLKKCAVVLKEQYDSHLPADYDALRKLPGIGPYTAGAIASIAFGLPCPAVDGNVLRVLARLHNDGSDVRAKAVHDQAEEKIKAVFASDSTPAFVASFNQGLMELGEVICLPNGTPLCSDCPLFSSCQANLYHTTDHIPYRSPLQKRKIEKKTVLVIRDGDAFLLHKRDPHGLLASLYEFPSFPGWLSEKEAVEKVSELGTEVLQIHPLMDARHIFTHLEWHMKGYEVRVSNIHEIRMERCTFATIKELHHMAVPSAFDTYMKYYDLRDQRD